MHLSDIFVLRPLPLAGRAVRLLVGVILAGLLAVLRATAMVAAATLTPLPTPVAALTARVPGLASCSRRSRQRAVERIARLLSNGRADAASLDWAALDREHAAALRARLAERCAWPTVNDHLSVLRRVLGECRWLGLLDQAAYARVACITSFPGARSRRAPAARSLWGGAGPRSACPARRPEPAPGEQAWLGRRRNHRGVARRGGHYRGGPPRRQCAGAQSAFLADRVAALNAGIGEVDRVLEAASAA